jgi:HD-GYP domain-containing protein (c-di-GMP phosphodiesterase class II)
MGEPGGRRGDAVDRSADPSENAEMNQPSEPSFEPAARPRSSAGTALGSPRLADVLASLSLVADLGFGLPAETSMRSCLVATALARRLGLAEAEVSVVFYTALLEHVGCSGFAHETAQRYGDELVVNAAAARTNTADPRDVLATFLPEVTRGRRWLDRGRVVLRELADGSAFGLRYATAACEVGQATARRLGLAEGVQRSLHEVFEQWNGKGGGQGLKGEAITLPARITQVAATTALFGQLGGLEPAVRAVGRQAGGLLDPAIAAAFLSDAAELLAEGERADPHAALLDVEPRPARTIAADRLADVAAAFADLVDLKSPFLLGHSSGVASLAREAGARLGLDGEAIDQLGLAGLLHDLGRVGVSDSIWDRPGPISSAQWEQVRLHAYRSERILARSAVLRPIAEVAGMHHERLDGTGYHRGSRAREIPMAARVLGVADAYQAMTQARSFRAPLAPEEAARRIQEDVHAGRLDADAAVAVLDVAGQGRPRLRAEAPAGLSDREIEVLRALARGLSNREIADRFTISPRTAEHHVQHIYTKIGASSRAAAALFAMEHDLLD